MDPIEQILAQGRGASSGPGQSPQAAAFFQGQQTSLSRRKLDQDQQQIDAELSLLPIKIKEAQQNQEMKSLMIQKQIFERDNQIKAGKAALDGFSTLSSMIREGETSARVTAAYADVLAENPFLPTEVRQGMETIVKTYESDSVRRDLAADRVQTQEQIAEARNANAIALAQLNTGSREKVAETGAESREKVAAIRSEAQLAAAKLRLEAREKMKETANMADLDHLKDLEDEITKATTTQAIEKATKYYNIFLNKIQKADPTLGRESSFSSFLSRNLEPTIELLLGKKENQKKTPEELHKMAFDIINTDWTASQAAARKTKATPTTTNPVYNYDPANRKLTPAK